MRYFITIFTLLLSGLMFSQKHGTIKVKKSTDEVQVVAEEMPQFPGGEKAIYDFLAENITYPDSAKLKDIAGTFYVQFIIEKDGSITSPTIARGIDKELNQEVLRAVYNMPKWIPGKQRVVPVRVRYTLPIKFQLQ